ncbi:MAG: hypothetical protein ACJARG_000572, partial [Arcticibacterium sp.]
DHPRKSKPTAYAAVKAITILAKSVSAHSNSNSNMGFN